jgi:hypothetical protein
VAADPTPVCCSRTCHKGCACFGIFVAPAHSCACPRVFAVLQLKAATGTDSNLLDTHRGTHRSNIPGSNLVTARLVDIDMPPGDDEPHRAPAHLADSPTGSDEVGLDADTCVQAYTAMQES